MHNLNIESLKISHNAKYIIKNILSSNFKKLVFIGDDLDNIISEIASSINAIIIDIDDYDNYKFDENELYIRLIKNKFHIYRPNVIEIYITFNDDNTDIIANSECVINFRSL
jgi:Mg2+/Co2+ transporter CorB